MNYLFILTLLSSLLQATIAQTSFAMVYFQIPAPIYHIKSTYTVPPLAHDNTGKGLHSFWMGIEPANSGTVFQNVVADAGDDGSWQLFPMYCCNPTVTLENAKTVYPGDSIVNEMAFDTSTTAGVWTDNFTVSGRDSWGGKVTLDPSQYPKISAFQNAFLAVELQGGSSWESGSLTFTDIQIDIAGEVEDGSWCMPKQQGGGTISASQPVVYTNGNGRSGCCIESIVLSP